MKTSPLLCLLLLTMLPMVSEAHSTRNRDEVRAFRRENPCPATGTVQRSCAGWQVGYIVALCANGQDKRENMRWVTPEDQRFVKAANGKHCKKLKRIVN